VLDLHRAWELHLSNDAVVEFLGGTPSQVPAHYREASPAERTIPGTVQKLVHGTADDSVPYSISQIYAERKKKSGEDVELITLPGTGHFEIVDPESSVWPEIEHLILALTSA
jgi:pimeloyl-ACP methyl ester carboxylesterase